MTQQIRAELVALLPRLRRFAYGLTGSLDEGDDLVQSACERALARLHQFRPGTRLDSWMYRIVQTLWIDRWRVRQLRRESGGGAEEIEALAVGDARKEMDSRLSLATVRRAVARLPEEQRAVLVLVCVEGQSYKAAAGILGIPIGTVMSRLARARLALGRALDGDATASPQRAAGRP